MMVSNTVDIIGQWGHMNMGQETANTAPCLVMVSKPCNHDRHHPRAPRIRTACSLEVGTAGVSVTWGEHAGELARIEDRERESGAPRVVPRPEVGVPVLHLVPQVVRGRQEILRCDAGGRLRRAWASVGTLGHSVTRALHNLPEQGLMAATYKDRTRER